MRPPEDEALRGDMLDHARRAVAAARGRVREDLDSDDLLSAALERFIEVVGEAASRVSAGTRQALPRVPWREVVGMHNRLAHGYASVDRGIVWAVVSVDLLGLIAELEQALSA